MTRHAFIKPYPQNNVLKYNLYMIEQKSRKRPTDEPTLTLDVNCKQIPLILVLSNKHSVKQNKVMSTGHRGNQCNRSTGWREIPLFPPTSKLTMSNIINSRPNSNCNSTITKSLFEQISTFHVSGGADHYIILL